MVRSLRLPVMSGALLLALASCQVLFVGAFPPSISQATAKTDLSALVAAAPASYFSLSTVTANGLEYVLLFTSMGFDSTQAHLVVLDPQLKVLNTFTLDQIIALPTAGGSFFGNFTMTDVNDRVIIGNLRFDALAGGLAFSQKDPAIGLYSPSVSGLPVFPFHETNFRVVSSNFAYDEFNSAWGLTANFSVPLGIPSPPSQSTLFLVNVFTDRDSGSAPDVFVFQDFGAQRTYFLRIPKGDIDGGLSVAAPSVFSYYPSPVVKSNLSGESIGYSRAGVIGYDQKADALVRFTLDAPDSVSSLPLKRTNGLKVAAGISGTWCVVWDPDTRMVTRYEQWW